MEIINPEIQRYAEVHTSSESELLRQINRHTHANVLMPRMLSGHLQGRFLAMISQMLKPKKILEIGTYTGYSAICLSEGLSEQGYMITIDINEELEQIARKNFEDAGVTEKVRFYVGDAREIVPKLTDTFDLIFIDADKENYSIYFDLVFDKLNAGGVILADNVLWSGKVLQEKKDKDTRAIDAFNQKIMKDERVEKVLLPIRDGIFMIRKLSLQNF